MTDNPVVTNTSSSGFACSLVAIQDGNDTFAIMVTSIANILAFSLMVVATKFLISKAMKKCKKGTKRNERPQIIQHNIVPMSIGHHSHPMSTFSPHYSFGMRETPEASIQSTEISVANELQSADRSKSTTVFNEVEIVDCLHVSNLEDDLMVNDKNREFCLVQGELDSEMEKKDSDPDGIFYITDEAIRKRRGIDALNYLLFLRHLIYFLGCVAFLCTFIILPINLMGKDTKGQGYFIHLTIENVPPGSQFFWAHILVANSFLPIGIAILLHNYTASVLQHERFASRTLFIRKKTSKKPKLAREDIVSLVQEITTNELVIEGIQFVYDVRNMRRHKDDFICNFSAEKFCLNYLNNYDESFELRPYSCGQWLGLLGLGCFFPKTYALTHYRRKKWEAIRNLIRDYSRVISRAQEAFFITFKTEEMTRNVYNQINCSCFCSACCRNLSPLSTPHETESWKASFAPDPMDINWDALVVKKRNMWVRSCWVNMTLFAIFFFCTTPSFVLPFMSNWSTFESFTAWQQANNVYGLEPLSFLAQYSKPLALLSIASVLPNVVFYFSSLVPAPLKSEQTHAVMWRTYCFMILMIIIIPSLGQSSFHEVVRSIVSKQTFQWYCLFHSYEYSFFIIYVVQSAFIGNGLELLRSSRIISYFFVKIFQTSSEAEFDHEINQIDLEFNLGLKYSRILFMVTMILLYSVSCPLITIVGLIFMVIKYYVDRHSLYHSCYPSSVSCKTYRRITVMFFSTIVMMQFHLFTIIYTKNAPRKALAFDLILLLISLGILPCLTSLVRSAKSTDSSKVHTTTNQPTDDQQTTDQSDNQPNWCCCAYLPEIIKQMGKSKFQPKQFNDDTETASLDTRTKDTKD
ncbi:CSC1-like protein 1 isoform X3 [Panonychus citri]|uniref:CSC1-like protein 1 isoform X3 n=1 Tax=Panonychus citri TaxID=50023 RepID=UPI002307817B|nr:CSC1-like protein 1 isoform X3 [Panonychus citri]